MQMYRDFSGLPLPPPTRVAADKCIMNWYELFQCNRSRKVGKESVPITKR